MRVDKFWGSIAALLATAFLTSWIAYAPYYALHRLQDSDAVDLQDYVDFPAFRDSIKGEVGALMSRSMPNADAPQSPFAALGNMIASSMLSAMVDSMVTPESIGRMARGEPPQKPGPAGLAPVEQTASDTRVTTRYTRWNRFEVVASPAADPRRERALVLTRSGIGRKLVAVRLSMPDE